MNRQTHIRLNSLANRSAAEWLKLSGVGMATLKHLVALGKVTDGERLLARWKSRQIYRSHAAQRALRRRDKRKQAVRKIILKLKAKVASYEAELRCLEMA